MIVSGGFTNTSGGYDCQCKSCARMSPTERIARGLQIHDARRRAGQIRAAQPSAALARAKGFASVMENRPEVLLWLKKRIKSQNKRKAAQLGITPSQYRKKRLADLQMIYAQQ